MGSALKIRDDLTPLELRRWARVESYGRAAARAYGIAGGRCPKWPDRDGSPNASRRGCSLQCKGIGGASRPSKGLLAAAADGRRGSGASSSHRDGVCAWTRRSVPLAGGALRQDLPPLGMTRSTADEDPPEGAPEPPAKGRRSAGALQKRGLRDILKAFRAVYKATTSPGRRVAPARDRAPRGIICPLTKPRFPRITGIN